MRVRILLLASEASGVDKKIHVLPFQTNSVEILFTTEQICSLALTQTGLIWKKRLANRRKTIK